MVERQKAPQKIELGLAAFLALAPAFGTAQHAHKTAQQFRQRIEHLCPLPRLRHRLEKLPANPARAPPPVLSRNLP